MLGAADPSTPVWTWATQQDAGFVLRHQVQEAAVHRWDAEHAVGRPAAIAPAVAGDAVEEFLSFSLRPGAAGRPALQRPLEVAATDTGQAWLLRPSVDRLVVEAAPGSGTAPTDRIAGAAADLLLWLYGRRSAQVLTVTGDQAAPAILLTYAKTD